MTRKLFVLSVLFITLQLSTLLAQTKFIPYQQLPDYNGSSTGSGIYFSAVMNSSFITITFEGPANRWIALGLGNSMQPTDVFIYTQGHASSSHPVGWYDYYNNSYSSSGITLDATQNWSVVSTNTVTGGQRTVTATRTLSTGDPSDIAVSFTASALDVVWARGSSTNFSISYHGNTNRASGISLPWLTAPTASFSSSSQTLCQGSAITFSNLSSGGQTTYTWNFPGGNPASSTSTNPVVTYTAAGQHSVVLTASNAIGTNTLSQVNYITVTPSVVPSVSIALSAGNNPLCAGSGVTFSASSSNGGPSPSYQWKINSVNAGSNSVTFSTNALNNSNTVTCLFVSNQSCVNPATVTSAGITMTVNSSAPSSVSIVQNLGNNPLCLGTVVGFSASPFNGGTSPAYQWQVNGGNVGLNSPTFTSSSLANGDVVTCILQSNDACASSTLATSSGITMTVSTLLSPSVNIGVASPGGTLCSGASIQFTADAQNGGSNPTYQWFVNGNSVGTNTASYVSNNLNQGDVVICVLFSGLTCASPSSVSSAPLSLTIEPTPASPSISVSGATIICPGENVLLSSSTPNNNYWSNNAQTNSIVVSSAGVYSLMQVVNSCSSAATSVSISEHPVITPSISVFETLCQQSDPVLLTGEPAGGVFSGLAVQGGSFQPQLASTSAGNMVIYTLAQTFGTVTCNESDSVMIIVNDCTGINEVLRSGEHVNLYPNPSSGTFYIDMAVADIVSLRLVNLQGKVCALRVVPDNETLALSLEQRLAGVYLLYIETHRGVFVRRLMIQEP